MSCCGKKRKASRAGRATLASPIGVISRRPGAPAPSTPSLMGGMLRGSAVPEGPQVEENSREATPLEADEGEIDA